METIVLVTGGFDPIHSGHLEYFKAARALGDRLVVGLNSDTWLTRKKGRPFMNYEERYLITANLKMVDEVIAFDDTDNSSCHAIERVLEKYPDAQIIFANGGDRTVNNIPEMRVKSDRLVFKFAVGGANKANSSSWILEDWKAPKSYRQWGYYRVLHELPGMKVKELTVDPGKQLSMQRHNHRGEYWMVGEGVATVYSQMPNGYALPPKVLNKHDGFTIPLGEWHQLANEGEIPLKVVEIQYGASCEEEDIERK